MTSALTSWLLAPCIPASRNVLSLGLLLALATALPAQTQYPKPPETYQVDLRYRIRADRNERIRQFDAMSKFLKDLGFKETPYEDMDLAPFDPNAERMNGTIPGENGAKILNDPRVQTVILTPGTFKAPDDLQTRVKVRILLNAGFTLPMQRLFSMQTADRLARLGFIEGTGYDHRGYTILRGTMPWVKVYGLLKDLRTEPAGWFVTDVSPEELPEPFRQLLPIRLVEILSEEGVPPALMPPTPLPPIPPENPNAIKLSAEIRQILSKDDAKVQPLRVDLFMVDAPAPTDDLWREVLRKAVPSVNIEGQLGTLVSVSLPRAEDVLALARIKWVTSIRLPRSRSAPITPVRLEQPKEPKQARGPRLFQPISFQERLKDSPAPAFDPLVATGLDRLHALNGQGHTIRVAIIDTDFTGLRRHVGKELPTTTQYLDVTAMRTSTFEPEPNDTPKEATGQGTLCALAVRYAAPAAELTLIRVSPDAPYQLITILRYIMGDTLQPEGFRYRQEEIQAEVQIVRTDRATAMKAYKKAFDNFDDDEEAILARRAAKAAIADIEKREAVILGKMNRFLQLEEGLRKLKGIQVILNTLGWNSGMALEAGSPLAQAIDERLAKSRPPVVRNGSKQPKVPLWVQPAGDTRGQSWVGLYHDADSNGVMEFAPPEIPLRKDRWTSELNFLAFRPHDARPVEDLPEKARVRITIQWREPHDPDLDEREYREPIVPLQLQLLRQRDPSGEKIATDELDLVARTEAIADRLFKVPEFGVYEQTIETTLPASGRYALRVEGRVPNSRRPGGNLGLESQIAQLEIRPRIFVEVLDGETQARGRIIFQDYETGHGGVVIPAESRSVLAVGACHPSKRPQLYSALGAGPNSEMLLKPDVMAYDELPALGGVKIPRGTVTASAFAAGMSACLISKTAPTSGFLQCLRIPPGFILEVPEPWVQKR